MNPGEGEECVDKSTRDGGVTAAPAWALLSCHETEDCLGLLSLGLVKDK